MSEQELLAKEISELEEIQEFLDGLLPQLEEAMDHYDLTMAETINNYTDKVDSIEAKTKELKESTKQKVTARRAIATA